MAFKARCERHAGGRVRSAGDGESGKSRRELVDCVRRGPRRGGCIRHRVTSCGLQEESERR